MLTVLMATFNGAATLPRVLEAYCALAEPLGGWSLLVIDNGSIDGTRAVVEAYRHRLPLRYLHEPRRGKSSALNSGVAHVLGHSQSGLLVFSDDDAAPEPDWLLRLAGCAAENPGYAVFGGAITPDWARQPPEWITRLTPLGLTYGLTSASLCEGPVFPGLVWGANMAVRRIVFEAGQRFDETIGPNGSMYAMGCETEFTRRVHAQGFRSWFCPAARVSHYIRAHQLSADYVLERAWRFGRGQCRQAQPGVFPEICGIPRWMLNRFAQEGWRMLKSWLQRRPDSVFLHRWEMAYLRGYFYESRRGVRSGGKAVLITSYSGELGGMELRMAQEARFLAAAGHRSVIGVRRFAGFDDWVAREAANSVTVSAFDPPAFFERWSWRRLNKLRASLWGARRLRNYRADLVHVAMCWTSYGASALWLANRCRLPVVLSVHNSFAPERFSDWHAPLLRDAFGAVNGIYAVSETAMRGFMNIFRSYVLPSTRLAVIPNSVDTEVFQPSPQLRVSARRALKLPPDCMVIGSVARLSPQKRPETTLRLFTLLRQQFPGLYLVLVGGGPLEDELRDKVRQAGLQEYVIFTGFVPAVEQIMPAFDLHLLMSRNEGFGISTIEAMACGVPAVATEVPGSVDILRNCPGGQLVPVNDLPVAAAIVASLLRDPQLRQRMAQAARTEAETRYSHAVVGDMVREFYDGLL